MDSHARSDFARLRLPWLLTIGALILFTLTLNRWVSISSLGVVSALLSPDPEPTAVLLQGPLQLLLGALVSLLPASMELTALNFLSALFAALTLGLLARSVAILPHDRTREERHRQTDEHARLDHPLAWIPPLLAAVLLGLQLSFWEHATAASGQMLTLLLLAYVVRCLLEYRLDRREGWLFRMAVVYGVGITHSWAFIGYFPLVLAALVWIQGRAFFRTRLLLRLTACGLAGLTLYLLVPLVTVLKEDPVLTFWQALRFQWVLQKQLLLGSPRDIALIAALTSLLPLLLIGIRWPSSFGDTSAIGNLLTNYVFRVVYALFLAAGLCLMLDLVFSPRVLFDRKTEVMVEVFSPPGYLSFYYLAALAMGYFIGYYLIVFGSSEDHRRHRRKPSTSRVIDAAALGLVLLTCTGVAVAQVWQNAPALRANNGRLLKQYASGLVGRLPAEGAVLLCDQPLLLNLVNTLLKERGEVNRYLTVDTRSLDFVRYQRTLRHRNPDLWPALPDELDDMGARLRQNFVMLQVATMAGQSPVFYLHPSFGYPFEPAYLEPHGLLYRLRLYTADQLVPPPLAPEVVQLNSETWSDHWSYLERLGSLVRQRHTEARMVGNWYGLALNYWGVELQRAQPDALEDAARFFELAVRLNPNNVSAGVNLAFNRSLQAGKPRPLDAGKSAVEIFGTKYRTWDQVLRLNGPIDDPRFCLEVGVFMLQQRLNRQATLQFSRAVALAPNNPLPRLYLANTYADLNLPDRVLEITADLRRRLPQQPLSASEQVTLVRLEGLAMHAQGSAAEAEQHLLQGLRQYPGANPIIDVLLEIYRGSDRLENALTLLDDQIPRSADLVALLLHKSLVCIQLERFTEAGQALTQILAREPNHIEALLRQAVLYMQTKQLSSALATLDRILELEPNQHAARLNRAITRLQNDQLEDARRDYEILLVYLPFDYRIHYGLGVAAAGLNQTGDAIKHFELYLRTAPPDTAEARDIASRLEALRNPGADR
jgi:tetratricopeptide (TPR) repeat protein